MNYRPKRSSFLRRFSPVAVLLALGLVFVGHMALADAATVTPNTTAACQGSAGFTSYYFTVNGVRITHTGGFNELRGKTKPGATVAMFFVVKPSCTNLAVGITSFTSNGPAVNSDGSLNTDQKQFGKPATGVFAADGITHHLQVTLPICYYQVDAFTGTHFTVGDFNGAGGAGFITSDVGGKTNTCTTVAPAPVAKPAPVVKNTVAIAKVCRPDAVGWSVTYTNSGTTAQSFTLTKVTKAETGAATIATVSVPAGQSVTKTYLFADYNIASGQSVTVAVLARDATSTVTTLKSVTLTNNCAQVVVGYKCTTTGSAIATFALTNNATVDETFEVLDSNGNPLAISPVTVTAGASITKTVTVANNAQTNFEIKGDVSGIDVTRSVSPQCPAPVAPTAPAAPAAAAPTATATAVVVVKPAAPCSTTSSTTSTTAAPAPVVQPQVLAQVVAPAPAPIVVAPAPVAAPTTPQLAYTGFTVVPLVALGTLLIVFGTAIILGARRRSDDYI